ncbi:MAG: OmpA family protein, partial [Cytophagales bacterium]|nr:OmpA family protein [Cytophagales bacterium]
LSFAQGGNTLVFARSNTGRRKGPGDVDLYLTRFRRREWSEPEFLPLNDSSEWDSTPSFSSTGRTLIFASSREGGYGGTDLYLATMDSRGRFSYVRNLGKEVNTPGNEMFPHLTDDGKLYFASNGHPGLGGLDIFVAYKKNGAYQVENLGAPVNSFADDFAYFPYTPVKGFFCSNRPGGAGDDDIYTFRNEDPDFKVVNYFLAGKTKAKDPTTGLELILPNTRLLLLDADSTLMAEEYSARDGSFQFRLYDGERYDLVAQQPGYFTTRLHYSMQGREIPREKLTQMVTDVRLDTSMVLEKLVVNRAIVLEHIYYDFDKADIREDAKPDLDFLVDLLRDNPDIKIELSSHTDSRGEEDYNLDLSQRRAESAVRYMASRGIDPGRMIARGYGETKPLVPNAQTEEEHQTNRRTEFKVVEFTSEDFFENEGEPGKGFFDN